MSQNINTCLVTETLKMYHSHILIFSDNIMIFRKDCYFSDHGFERNRIYQICWGKEFIMASLDVSFFVLPLFSFSFLCVSCKTWYLCPHLWFARVFFIYKKQLVIL